MEQLFLVGPLDEQIQKGFLAQLPEGVALQHIKSADDYPRLAQADYIVLRSLQIRGEHIPLLGKAKLIQRWGVGYDTVDIREAGEAGIPVAVIAGANATPVAEMTLLLLLAVYRRLIPLHNGIEQGKWEREQYLPVSYTIEGKLAGIVGLGAIGKKVARLLRAFGADVIYHDAYRLQPAAEEELGVAYRPLEELLELSDIVSVHLPLTEDTRGLIDAEALGRMKRTAVLLNTAREEIVSRTDLVNALKRGEILGAGLDALEADVAQDNPFRELDNVVLTPHVAGNTTDNSAGMIRRCVANIKAVRAGEKLAPPDLVNGAYLNV